MKTIIAIWLLAACAIGGDTTVTGPLCEYRTREANPMSGCFCSGPEVKNWQEAVPAVCFLKCEPDSIDHAWQAPCKVKED